MIPDSLLRGLTSVVPLAFALFWLAIAVVHVAFALAVFRHAMALRTAGRRLVFVAPELWTLATLLGGAVGAAAYWLIHCSTIAAPEIAAPQPSHEDPDATPVPPA